LSEITRRSQRRKGARRDGVGEVAVGLTIRAWQMRFCRPSFPGQSLADANIPTSEPDSASFSMIPQQLWTTNEY
jgi:hypothetical protein